MGALLFFAVIFVIYRSFCSANAAAVAVVVRSPDVIQINKTEYNEMRKMWNVFFFFQRQYGTKERAEAKAGRQATHQQIICL